MKKVLALVLAFTMVFSSISFAFADTTTVATTVAKTADAIACETLGMIQGTGGEITAEYYAQESTRLQAAIMVLRLKGLEAEALAFKGEKNFADMADYAWAEGKNVTAYLLAHPELGFIGGGVNFSPSAKIDEQQFYKVMLTALNYKQTTPEVVGDYVWEDVLTFAKSLGLAPQAPTTFTNNDIARITVEALKATNKDGKVLYQALIAAGTLTAEKATEAGLIGAAITVAVDEATATGNAVVEVAFEDDVDAAVAGNIANYAIEGLEIKSVVVTGTDLVRLETAAMTSGKLYTLTVGEKSVKFTGIAKVSGGPEIFDVVSEDVEEVVITFNKYIDFATGSNVANYSMTGIKIVKAEVDGKDVILTTEGLKNKTKYTVKAINIKSVDGVAKKSDSDTFTSAYDLNAPKIATTVAETNQRIVVTFNEKVTKATAEDLANYSIKVDETDGAALEVLGVKYITTGDYKEKRVELVTEAMEKREDYVLSITNIADKRKVANVMTRPAKGYFEGLAEDESIPTWNSITVLSPTKILVEFKDNSRLDEASALDLNNYTLENLDIESIQTIKNEYQLFRALLTVEEMETGKSYDLTIVDVLDEFGNAMKETKKDAKALSGNFASAKLVSATATGENAITLVFDNQVDETTAENIANYSIDEEVGAPTKATLQSDNKTVKLEVNDLVNGYVEYDLVVDGVEDLAGNELYFKMKVNTATVWDTTAPELEDADIVNKYTVALSFDEKVKYETGTKLVLAIDGVKTNTILLDAKDIVDSDKVVEFSSATELLTTKSYTVVNVVYAVYGDGGIKDLVNNALLEPKITFGDFEFEGIADAPEAAELDSYEQINATTFEATMTRNVQLKGVNSVTTNGLTFAIDADEDVVTFVANGVIKEDEDYTFNFATLLEDYHGVAVDNADTATATILAGEYTDEDAPYVEEVVAKDRMTIKVTFSENMPKNVVTGADFTLKNYDLDTTILIDATVGDDDEDNVIYLTVGKALESRYEYELTIGKEKVTDYAGNKNESEETFYFEGTNLAK